jgi:hypothetical protein
MRVRAFGAGLRLGSDHLAPRGPPRLADGALRPTALPERPRLFFGISPGHQLCSGRDAIVVKVSGARRGDRQW